MVDLSKWNKLINFLHRFHFIHLLQVREWEESDETEIPCVHEPVTHVKCQFFRFYMHNSHLRILHIMYYHERINLNKFNLSSNAFPVLVMKEIRNLLKFHCIFFISFISFWKKCSALVNGLYACMIWCLNYWTRISPIFEPISEICARHGVDGRVDATVGCHGTVVTGCESYVRRRHARNFSPI